VAQGEFLEGEIAVAAAEDREESEEANQEQVWGHGVCSRTELGQSHRSRLSAHHGDEGLIEPVRFSVIGINHDHIYAQTDLLLRAGAELVSFFAEEPDLAAQFGRRYPRAKLAGDWREILNE